MKMTKNIVALMLLLQWGCSQESYYYNNQKRVTLIPEQTIARSHHGIRYYRTEKGIRLGVTKRVLVKVESAHALAHLESVYRLTLLKQLGTNLYLFEVEDSNKTLETANRLTHEPDVVYAHPDFLKKRVKR